MKHFSKRAGVTPYILPLIMFITPCGQRERERLSGFSMVLDESR